MPSLRCSTTTSDGLVVVAVAGDVDFATADVLWEELSAQLTPSSTVAMDCAEITFLDSMGLRSLVRAQQHAAEQQATFVLVGSNTNVDRVLELTGMTDLIPRFDDIDAAREGLADRAAE